MKSGQNSLTVADFGAFITYSPLQNEVDFHSSIPIPEGVPVYEIASRADLDPMVEATKAKEVVGDERTAIFIPGRSFDVTGTRHGRGGGWYDRFLAQVPELWVRIGFCFDSQFFEEPLIRQPWDQVMDYVAVVSKASGDLVIHATGARA